MLNEPVTEGGSTGTGTGTGGSTEPSGQGSGPLASGMGGGAPPGTMALHVTPQEKEAIERVSISCPLITTTTTIRPKKKDA